MNSTRLHSYHTPLVHVMVFGAAQRSTSPSLHLEESICLESLMKSNRLRGRDTTSKTNDLECRRPNDKRESNQPGGVSIEKKGNWNDDMRGTLIGRIAIRFFKFLEHHSKREADPGESVMNDAAARRVPQNSWRFQ